MKGIKLKKNIILVTLILIFFSCVISCGLDTFYVLEGPFRSEEIPTSITPAETRNFVFYTNDVQNRGLASDFFFQGTAIYYKIYSDENRMISDIATINSLNSVSNYSSAAEKLVSGLNYKELHIKNYSHSPIIAAANNDRKIRVRLTNNTFDSASPDPNMLPYFYINDVYIGEPCRDIIEAGQNLTFDFGRSNKDNFSKKPVSSDEDFIGDSNANIFYVNMYAFALGRDVTYKKYYSTVLHLGSISIDSKSEQN